MAQLPKCEMIVECQSDVKAKFITDTRRPLIRTKCHFSHTSRSCIPVDNLLTQVGAHVYHDSVTLRPMTLACARKRLKYRNRVAQWIISF